MIKRLASKLQQSVAFLRRSRTPWQLILDSFRLTRRTFVAISEDGLKFELQPGDGESFTFYENLIRRDYMQHGIRLNPGEVVIDIGGNIGLFAVLAAHEVGPGGRVFSFEPSASVFTRLSRNIQLNELRNVTAVNAAIGGAEGEAVLYVGNRSAYSALERNVDGNRPVATEPVRVTTLDGVMKAHGLDRVSLLKVDCEGSEYEIFDSLSPEAAKKIDQIAIEVHHVPGRDPDEIPQALARLGFAVRQTSPLVAFRIGSGAQPHQTKPAQAD